MSLFTTVNPDDLALNAKEGRGAWSKKGIDFDNRYMLSPKDDQRIGTRAHVSLDHWAVAAGSYAIQKRLSKLGILAPVSLSEVGIFGPRTKLAVQGFQASNHDPLDNAPLVVDGIVGRADARSLFVPLILQTEVAHGSPRGLLLGQTMHESWLDPGCVGYYIYYPEYRGVDRGLSQINSRFNPQVTWAQAYDPGFSFNWAAMRLRDYCTKYTKAYPTRSASILWDAALCAHNNPWAAGQWAKNGVAPTEQSAKYVAAVKAAIF
jgi:hypothetical protein